LNAIPICILQALFYHAIHIGRLSILHIEVGKQKIYLCHYPFLCFEGGYKEVWQLFGHVHTRKNNTGIDAERLQYLYPTQYDAGVDNNGFAPISFEQVNRIIKTQVEQSKMQ
jgi:calcineurin-like phosphoesterase family protein